MLETRLRVPFLSVEREVSPVAPFISERIESRVDVGGPGLQVLPADDVDHPAYSIGAIEGRRGSLHNLDTPYVVEIHSVVVHIVHGLARHPLTVDQEEDGIAAETAHIERCLLPHGEAELQSRQFLYKHVLDIGGVGYPDVMEGDESGYHRSVLQRFRRV